MSVVQPTPLPPQTELVFVTNRVKALLRRQAQDMVDIGTDLLRAKALLPHGEFTPWVEGQLGIPMKTGQRFMTVARRFGGKGDMVSRFPAGVVYELAAASTPDEVVERVLQGQLAPTLDAIRNSKPAQKPKPAPSAAPASPSDPADAARELAFALADFLDTVAFDSGRAAGYLIVAFDDAFGEHDLWIEFLTDLGDATVTASHKTSEARMSP